MFRRRWILLPLCVLGVGALIGLEVRIEYEPNRSASYSMNHASAAMLSTSTASIEAFRAALEQEGFEVVSSTRQTSDDSGRSPRSDRWSWQLEGDDPLLGKVRYEIALSSHLLEDPDPEIEVRIAAHVPERKRGAQARFDDRFEALRDAVEAGLLPRSG